MATITLFEHQKRSYSELGWGQNHPAIEELERLNEASEVELVHLGHKQLKATHFVGVIRIGETTLQILPKIDFDRAGDSDAAADSRPYQVAINSATRNLLYLLAYTHDLQVKEQDVAPLLTQRSDWFELLTRLLVMNLHQLMQRGLEHSYVTVEETLPVMRGRWQLERQLTRRPHVRHLFDVVYDEFSSDTPLNRVFRFVVGRLLLITQDVNNRRLLLDIHEWLAGVYNPGDISQPDLDRVHFTRLNEHLRPAFNLARLFIENSTFQLSSGQRHTFAFVFDMNRLFEEFVYRFVAQYQKRILPQGWGDVRIRAQSQGKTTYLAERLPEHREVFRLCPDLLFEGPFNKPILILDTKYKQLEANRRQLNVSEDDVYQMLAYATRLECPKTLILYPAWAGSLRNSVTFQTLGHSNYLVVATINLRQPLNCPDDLISQLASIFREVSHHGAI